MQYSIVGNQNPDNEPEEIDASRSEEVKILPPFGETPSYIIISTIILIIAGVITSGVVIIKKMVLKNK